MLMYLNLTRLRSNPNPAARRSIKTVGFQVSEARNVSLLTCSPIRTISTVSPRLFSHIISLHLLSGSYAHAGTLSHQDVPSRDMIKYADF